MFLAKQLLVLRFREINVAAQVACEIRGTNSVLFHDRLDVFEHRLALVRIDAERSDHVEQRVRMDVFLVRMATEHQFELRRRHQLANHVLNIVSDNSLGG